MNLTHTPDPDLTAQYSPEARERARLDNFIASARAEKSDIRAQIKAVLAGATETKKQLDKVTVAVANAEHKIRMLTAPRSNQVSARDRAIAAGLMGQEVTVEDLPAESFDKQLSAEDLASGSRALRMELEHLHAGMRNHKHQVRILQDAFYKQHAIEHAALYLIARSELVHSFMSLCAAQQAARESSEFAFLTPPHFEENFSVPSPDAADALAEMRKNKIVGQPDISGRSLVSGPLLGVYRAKINSELEA